MLGGDIVGYGGRLRPRMDGQSELVMVNGEYLFGLEVENDFLKVCGRSVDIFPTGIVLPVFQECQINGTEALVYLSKALVIASIATYIHLAAGSFD